MAEKKIVFQLEVDGARTLEDLRASIKATNEELAKAEIGSEAYRELEQQLARLKNVQKDVTDSARLTRFAIEASAEDGANSYRQLNAQLVTARALFKELTAEERAGEVGQNLIADIQRLDKELKSIDASIGQFQRNVGDYAGGVQAIFSKSVPGFSQLTDATNLVNEGIAQLGQTASATGKLLTGAFIAFQVGGLILDGVKQVGEFTEEINRLRGELGRLTGESDQAVDRATASVQAIRATFNAGAEETVQAANALQNAFDGLDINSALGLIETGFLSGANAGGELLDVLREYPRLFDQMGFSAEEFLAIQIKAGQEGVYSDKGVDAVKEFGIRIREQTVATRASLEQAFGRDFTQELFAGLNSGAITVKDALVQVSGQLKNTELPAKQLQQVISDVFGGPGEDAGDDFLKSLADIEAGVSGAIGQADEYTQRLQAQLAAEKELAAAKVEVTKQLNELSGGYQTLTTNAETFGVRVVGRLLEAIKPVRESFAQLGTALGDFLRQIGVLPAEGERAVSFLDVLGGLFRIVAGAITLVVDGVRATIEIFTSLFEETGKQTTLLGAFAGVLRFVGASFRLILDIVANLPAYFAGVTEAARQLGENIGNFFEVLALNAQILWAQVQQLNPFNDTDEDLDRQIADLRGKKAAIQETGRTLAEAFKAGFESVKKPEVAVTAPGGAPAVSGSKDKPAGATVAPDLTTEEAKKLQKAQDDSLKAQQRYNDQRVALLRELTKRLADATIEGIDDDIARQIAAEQQKFAALEAELATQEQKLIAQQKEAREKLAEGFGVNSPQVAAFDTQAAAGLEAQREVTRAISEQNEKNHLDRVAQIREEAANAQARAELERVRESISERDKQFEDAAVREETKVQAQITRILKSSNLSSNEKQELILKLTFEADVEALQQESIRVFDQIQTIEAKLQELSENDDLRQASTEEYEYLSDLLDQLYNKRATLERQHTEIVNEESEKRKQKQFEEIQGALDQAAQVVQIADQFAAASAQREINNIQEKEDARKASIDRIKGQLETATGAEKAALEKRLKSEQDGLKKLEEERAKVEKEEAKRQKAFAIIQAIINTAAAVVKTISTLGVPAGIPAAILAGALGAAQIAVIAAQPVATGGVIGARDVHEQKDGLVVAAQNIPQLRNGDNVLATLKRGEVVLNRDQQKALGGAPTFRAIRVPGFADGGAAGAIISAPDVSGTGSAERIRLLENISAQTANTLEAVNNRVDRIRVFVVSQDVQDDIADGDTLQAAAILSPD